MKTFLISFLMFAGLTSNVAETNITPSPGSSTQIQAGQTINVTCSGSAVGAGCTCEVCSRGSSSYNYRIKKNGTVIGDYYGSFSETETGRTCISQINNEALCK
jgi:hypothetical protein